MKFRKKPVVIEAVQFSNKLTEMYNKEEMLVHFGDFKDWYFVYEKGWEPLLIITTLKGEMFARQGDWIIKGVNGEFYPCKPDIFEKTYEPIN